MKLGLRFREELTGLSGYLVEELDGILSAIKGLYLQHEPTGRHGDIEATKVTFRIADETSGIPSLLTPVKFLTVDSGVVHPETVTLANISNTTTETSIIKAKLTHAVADGDMLLVCMDMTITNTTGGNESITLDVAYGGVEADLINQSINTGNTGRSLMTMGAIRKGTTLECSLITAPDSATSWGGNKGATLTAPLFSSGQTIEVKGTATTASASLAMTMNAGVVLHLKL